MKIEGWDSARSDGDYFSQIAKEKAAADSLAAAQTPLSGDVSLR
jgi:hypothetical protein